METIQSSLSSIRSQHVDRGLSVDIFADERLKRMIKGLKRKRGVCPPKASLEITKELLQTLVSGMGISFDEVNLRAAYCTAFAAFLRVGEFTWDGWSDLSHKTKISRQSVTFDENGNALLHLPTSKTDPFGKGTVIPLARSNNSICPVTALRTLFSRFPKPPTAPLFARTVGPFSRAYVVKRLQDQLLLVGVKNAKRFTGHAFRRGAANSAIDAGIPQQDIQSMGRWKSDSVLRYFTPSSNTRMLMSLSHKLHAQPGPLTSTTVIPPHTKLPRIKFFSSEVKQFLEQHPPRPQRKLSLHPLKPIRMSSR